MRQTFQSKGSSSTLEQQDFPSFGVVYLILLVFVQFFEAGLRVSKVLLLTDELRFSDNMSLIIIHLQASLMDLVMCLGNVITNLNWGPFASCIIQEIFKVVVTWPLCTFATMGIADLNWRWKLYMIGQAAGVISSFASASMPNLLADQFNKNNYAKYNLWQAFINLFLSAIGVFTTSHIIQYYYCFWTETCYSFVWLANWILTFITFLILLTLYKKIIKKKPKHSSVYMIIRLALDARNKKRQAKRSGNLRKMPFLDHSKMYTPEFRKDAKRIWTMWTFYFPLAGYWALHSQYMTTMVLQAKWLDGDLFKWSNILPNDICGLVPLFGIGFRVLLEPFMVVSNHPLRAVVYSQVVITVAFFLAATLEWFITREGRGGLHILWMIPQMLLVSISDASLILSYREFVAQEVPLSMRGVTQALFLLSRCFGNLIVVVLNLLEMLTAFPNRMAQFLIYAAVLNLLLIVFAMVNSRYERTLDDERLSFGNIQA